MDPARSEQRGFSPNALEERVSVLSAFLGCLL